MAEITLSTGKIVVTRELSAYDNFLVSSFLTGTMGEDVADTRELPASIAFQMGQLMTIFSVEQVNGKDVKKPHNRKTLIQAFANFTSKEFEELQRKTGDEEGSETTDEKKEEDNTGESSNGS